MLGFYSLFFFFFQREWSDEADKTADFADKSQTRIQELKVLNSFFPFFCFSLPFSSQDAGNRLFYEKRYRAAMTKYKLALELDK